MSDLNGNNYLPFDAETQFCDGSNPYGNTQNHGAKLVDNVNWTAWWNDGQPNVWHWLNAQGERKWIRVWRHPDGRIIHDYDDPRTFVCVQFECNNLNLYGYHVFPLLVVE